jgi:ATP-dependent DNA ligase
VIAKDRNSIYTGGTRSLSWRKLKLVQAQEFVIGGYNPEGKMFSFILEPCHVGFGEEIQKAKQSQPNPKNPA